MNKIFKLSVLLTVLLLLFLGAIFSCHRNSTEPTSSTETPLTISYFPVQNEDPGIYMLALLLGKLYIDINGYLRINDTLVIWPYGYSYRVEGTNTLIIDKRGNLAVRVGEDVKIGGGYMDAIGNDRLMEPHPEVWEGPFWLASPLNYYPPASTATTK